VIAAVKVDAINLFPLSGGILTQYILHRRLCVEMLLQYTYTLASVKKSATIPHSTIFTWKFASFFSTSRT